MTKLIRKTADTLVNILLVLLMLAAIPLLAGRFFPHQKLPVVGGYQVLVVHGGSMEPSIKLGSVILIRAIDPTKIKIGDVVSFRPPKTERATSSPPEIATHRVVEVHQEKVYGDIGTISFRTKGDANEEADMQLISSASVMGRVVLAIPYVGYLVRYARSPLGLALMVLVPVLILATGVLAKVMPGPPGHQDAKAAAR